MKTSIISNRLNFKLLILSFCFFINFSIVSYGQSEQKNSPSEIQQKFQWPEGKKAAISLSFDDARYSQVDFGIPLFDKYNVKATFYVSPIPLRERLESWKKAAANGHEIANHTIKHPCSGNFTWARHKALEDYTLEQMAQDIDDANDTIERLIGESPVTFAYPCGQMFIGRGKGQKTYAPLIANRFIAGRGWLDEAPNDPLYCDMSRVYGMKCDGYDFSYIEKLIDKTVEMGGWLVLAGHNILPEGEGLTTYTSMLEELCAYANDPANGIWIAPVKDIAMYINDQRGEIQKEVPAYLVSHQPIEKRVDDLLSRLLRKKSGK